MGSLTLSAKRKLSPEEQAAAIAWWSEYQAALTKLRTLGTPRQKAGELGVGRRTFYDLVKPEYKFRSKLRAAGVATPSAESNLDTEKALS